MLCSLQKHLFMSSEDQGQQYRKVRSEFAYYVPRTLNCTVPAYRTSVQYFEAYRTLVPYCASEP